MKVKYNTWQGGGHCVSSVLEFVHEVLTEDPHAEGQIESLSRQLDLTNNILAQTLTFLVETGAMDAKKLDEVLGSPRYDIELVKE